MYIKLFVKNENDLETLIQTIRIYNQDIGMEFSIEKCNMLTKSDNGSIWTIKLRKNPNAKSKGNRQVLENIRSGHHQTSGDERKIKKDFLRWTGKFLETKLYSRNLIKI